MIPTSLFLVALSVLPQAGRSVEVVFKGEVELISPEYTGQLVDSLEDLAVHSGFAVPLSDLAPTAKLSIVARFSPPLELGLRTPTPRNEPVSQLSLLNDDNLNEGWPLLVVTSAGSTWSLVKYSGGAVLDILCSDELRPLASRKVIENCHVAPSRRNAHGGSPNNSLERTNGLCPFVR